MTIRLTMAKSAPVKPTTKPATSKPAAKKPPAASDPDLAKLPAALQKQAEKAEKIARERVLREARAAFDEAHAAMEQAARGYYALGRALVTLARAGFAEALGYDDFRALCDRGLGLSKATVDRLTSAVANLSAAQYAALRPARVDALLSLAAATPADDTREILEGKVITLWESGPTLDVAKATTAQLREAAVSVREHVAVAEGKGRRGRSSSLEERTLARDGSAQLKGVGSKATAKTRATAPGKASVFDLIGLDAEEFKAAVTAVHKRHAAKKK